MRDEVNHLTREKGGVDPVTGGIPVKGSLQRDTGGRNTGEAHLEIQEVKWNNITDLYDLISRGDKCQLMAKSRLRDGTELAVFIPEVAKQHRPYS